MNLFSDVSDAATFAAIGAIVGMYVFHSTGAAGLTIGGGGYPIGNVAFASVGAVAGLALFGTKKSIFG